MRYYAFDLLYLEGYDLTSAALVDRKALLQQVFGGLPGSSPIRYSEHLETDGPTMLEHSCRLGLEGIISKRKDAPYRSGRGDAWLKSKCRESQEFVILGYVPSTAATKSVGSLALGYNENGKLIYAGRVGTGWSTAVASALWKELDKIRAKKPAFGKPLPAGAEKDVVWVEPRLVGEIEFTDWTHDDVVRQASFKGLRDDKPPGEIVREASGRRAALTQPKTTAVQAHASRAHPVARRRHHQAGSCGFLHRHRRLDSAAHHRARAEPGALSIGHRREVLLRQASLGRIERGGHARRCRRQGADADDRRSQGSARIRPGGRGRNPSLGLAPRAARNTPIV